MKHLLKLFLTVAFIVSLGCSQKADKRSGKVIGISMMTMSNPFFVELAQAAEDEAKKHGYSVIVYGGEEADKQAKQIRDFITQKVDAIILSPKDTFAIGAPIKEANAARIPVITADTGCSDTSAKVVCNVTTDNYGGGKLAGKAMIQALENKGGKILILDYKEAASCIQRVDGFKKVIKKYNEDNPSRKIEIVAELAGKASEEPSKKATEDQLNANPDLAGIFAINDPSALGAVVALKQAGKNGQVKVVGFDGMPRGKTAIKNGDIFADPIQFPDEIGRQAVRQVVNYQDAKEIPAEILIDTKLYFKEDAENDASLKGL